MMLRILLLLSLLIVSGCKTVTPSVLTEDRSGEPLTQVEIPSQGDRGEIPVGVDAGDVVAQVHTDSGSTIVIAENKDRSIVDRIRGKKKYKAYLNNEAVKEAETVKKQGEEMVTQPKAPWWKYPLYALIGLIVLVFIYFLRPLIDLLRAGIEWMGRFKR